MSTLVRVLILEDRAADADLMLYELRQAGFDPDWQRVETEPDYLAGLKTNPDLILVDWSLPQFSGWRALELMNECGLDIPFIIVSGSIGEEVAIEAMRWGADDYVFKDHPARLGQAVQHALKNKQVRQERERADELLRESELKFRGIFEQSSDGIVLADEQGIIIEWNKSQEQITDIRRDDALGKPVWDVLFQTLLQEQKTAITHERFRTNTQSLLRTGQAVWLNQLQESVILHSDGTQRSVQAVMFPIRTVNGMMVASIVRDITERKRAEEALKKSESGYQHLFDNANDVILVFEPEQEIILEANAAACADYGFDHDELVGMSLKKLTKDVLKGEAQVGGMMESGAFRDFESVHFNEKGEQIHFLINSSVVEYHGRKAILSINRDITERRRAEEKIRLQLERLTALREIDQAITATFDMRLSLNALVLHTVNLLAVDAVSVLLLNPAMNTLEYGDGLGFWTNAVKTASVKLGESYAGRTALGRRIVQIPNLADEPDNPLFIGFLKGENFASYYGAPLIVKGKVIGVLEVFHRSMVERDREWVDFFSTLAGQAAIAIDNARLFEDLQISNTELSRAYEATIEGWSRALDLRDKETEGHTLRVAGKTLELARLMGFTEEELVHIRRGALLHDIGKMGVPDGILLKAGSLTDDEWGVMRKHPTFACELLSPIHYLKSAAIDIPYCHHEKWDGTGYPQGLKGEQSPLAARIFAIVDVWDALTSDRPYRSAWTKEQALKYIREQSGKHFDPKVVEIFLGMIEKE